ncbi:hypothetical protein PFICI_12405 [Pestalotiopsis fici W106-1]|uniref:Uncharacterized protein n=1 Tax=Pestalotiopsis fici (strain W106-1 / CGMCC3.15140) TaxID=1229662 RepID=W3WRL1_PESFW|nr:uncharacterized protein PFICI_12405 [Pestalotiopsis fici W106-1]ETS75461.1 hypothetical protein PFICI_12405 [Pestalotiopsis fici W106-1]
MSNHSQRSTYAHNLGKDPKSTEQGFVWDIVPCTGSNNLDMRDMEFVDGGIHFVHIYGGSGVGTIQPRRIAVALPLAFVQSLANVALGPEAESRASAIKSYLNLWHDKSFLFDMILEDERALRLKKRRPDSHPIPAIFQKHPTLMPRVFKSWAPLNTVVEIYSEVVVVIYEDQNHNNLIRVRIARAPEIQPIKLAPRPCAVNAKLRFIDDHVYDISPLTIAVPSDLAKVIESIAINAARWEPFISHHCYLYCSG